MSEYIKAVRAKYFFGCSSINITNALEVGLIYKHVKDLYISKDSLRVYPKNKYRIVDILPICIKYKAVNGDKISSRNKDLIFYYGDIKFLSIFLSYYR